ncbi:hypothetical protein BpHYR1_037164 [Brachionus plicatilis]|uniref:Uncharacterized protein n=1 Tax=Brachionus plicatilis TaxID=10195 RepID=A0A3M7REW2_BRAPC|nr:hypothetical protein BpHYR1_037164 [Brachionus plicatilis]
MIVKHTVSNANIAYNPPCLDILGLDPSISRKYPPSLMRMTAKPGFELSKKFDSFYPICYTLDNAVGIRRQRRPIFGSRI